VVRRFSPLLLVDVENIPTVIAVQIIIVLGIRMDVRHILVHLTVIQATQVIIM